MSSCSQKSSKDISLLKMDVRKENGATLPGLSLRTPQNLTANRAAITEQQIVAWFSEVYKYIEDNNLVTLIGSSMCIQCR